MGEKIGLVFGSVKSEVYTRQVSEELIKYREGDNVIVTVALELLGKEEIEGRREALTLLRA